MFAIGLMIAAILGLILSFLIADYERPIVSFLLGSIIICASIFIYYIVFMMALFIFSF